jgi:hypothetical protein
MSMIEYCNVCKKNYEVKEEFHELCGVIQDPPTERGFLELPKRIWITAKDGWYFLSDGIFGQARHVKPYNNPDDYPEYVPAAESDSLKEDLADHLEKLAIQLEDLAYQHRGKANDLRSRE